MQYHILNGDALKAQIPTEKIKDELIICRECLIDGNITGDSLYEFWDNRSNFIEKTYRTKGANYNTFVLPQFQRILSLHKDSVVNLWFGDDLFCQINLCYIVYLLDVVGIRKNIFLVKAQQDNWQEFGGMSTDELVKAYKNRQLMTSAEFELMLQVWSAFQQQDLEQLKTLSLTKMDNFPLFEEVIQAHIDRFPREGQWGRPQQRLVAIKEKLQTDNFGKIFKEFIKLEGIYGFGDTQVKAMLDGLPEI